MDNVLNNDIGDDIDDLYEQEFKTHQLFPHRDNSAGVFECVRVGSDSAGAFGDSNTVEFNDNNEPLAHLFRSELESEWADEIAKQKNNDAILSLVRSSRLEIDLLRQDVCEMADDTIDTASTIKILKLEIENLHKVIAEMRGDIKSILEIISCRIASA